METAVGFSNIMPKTNLKTQVQASKYICVRLISSSFPNWRKEPSEKTLNSVLVFYVSNSEVNSRSVDFISPGSLSILITSTKTNH